jgi:hypothetical protein
MSATSPRGAGFATQWLSLAVLVAVLGCTGRRIPVPAVSPEGAGQEALAQYDRNKDGFLDKDELKACPALASCWKKLDKDGDGRLSAAEIAERIQSYQTDRVGLSALAVKVTSNGKPLAGATVTLVPEKFLGDALQPASGVTDSAGVANVTTPGVAVPGVARGMFRVEISKKDAAGQESVPARYNQGTTLGVEIGPDQQGVLRLALRGS